MDATGALAPDQWVAVTVIPAIIIALCAWSVWIGRGE